ncbi:MAG: nitrite reductase (NAD(P)H) small subunit [Actinomycetota bacterium]
MTDLTRVDDHAPESPNSMFDEWVPVCPANRIRAERGVAALVHGVPVAIFRLPTTGADLWCCVDHIDPVTGVPVMARGLVGSTGEHDRPTVASPLYKQRYDLVTGEGIDDPTRSIGVHACEVRDGKVVVRLGNPETVIVR